MPRKLKKIKLQDNAQLILDEQNNINIGLELSFIKNTKKAKEFKFNNFLVQLRDESLRNQI